MHAPNNVELALKGPHNLTRVKSLYFLIVFPRMWVSLLPLTQLPGKLRFRDNHSLPPLQAPTKLKPKAPEEEDASP